MASAEIDSPLRCTECGYTIPDEVGARCPECGTLYDENALWRARRWRDLRASDARLLRRWLLVAGGVIVIYALGAGVVGQSAMLIVTTGIALSVGVAGSLVMGALASLAAPEQQRLVLRSAWLRALPWAHGPWLVIAPCSAIILSLALLDRAANLNGSITFAALVGGTIIWLVASVLLMNKAYKAWSRVMNDFTGAPAKYATLAETICLLLLVVIWCGSMIVGFLGGGLAAGAALNLAGLF